MGKLDIQSVGVNSGVGFASDMVKIPAGIQERNAQELNADNEDDTFEIKKTGYGPFTNSGRPLNETAAISFLSPHSQEQLPIHEEIVLQP